MKAMVLGSYKLLIRYGQALKYTDKKYDRYKIRRGLLEDKDLQNIRDIDIYIEKGFQKGAKLLLRQQEASKNLDK